MYSKEFILYMKDNIRLVKSLVIKSDTTVTSLNDYASSLGHTIQYEDPTTYPYYQNLSGVYHPMNRPMFITSLDTLANIPFTRDVLLKHKNTLREYQKLGEYFDNLVELNPDQEILIRGVLNPIPFSKSVPAKQGTILHYNASLVEDNEYDLLPELQSFIYIFFDNWYNKGYIYTDELFDASFFGVLASALVTRVMNIRLNKCGTSQVHSFHLWAKLGSNYFLDRFRDYIPIDTARWLYRNIDDIRSNLGRHYTFVKLIENIFTKNIIPAAQLIMKNDETVLDDNYQPQPYVFKNRLNTTDNGVLNDNVISTENLINRMMPLAEHNPINVNYDIADTNFQSRFSQTSANNTKVFETILGQGNNTNAMQLISDIINYLAYAIFTGLYSRDVIIKNNKGELVKVGIQEAFLVWIYIAHKLEWVEFSVIPEMSFKRLPRVPYGSFKEYRKAADPKYVDDIEIKTAMLLLESSATIDDSEEFSKRALTYNYNKFMHFMIYATRQELNSYVRTKQMINMFYINGKYKCRYTGKTYVEFFEDIGLSVDTYDNSYLEILFLSLFEDMTGFDYTKIGSTVNKQKKLVEVVKLLSSYTIQFVTQETTSSGGTTNPNGACKSLRASDARIDVESKHSIILPDIKPIRKDESRSYNTDVKMVKIVIKDSQISAGYRARVSSKIIIRGEGRYYSYVDVPHVALRILPKKSYYLPDYLPNNKLNGLLQFRFVDNLKKIDTFLNNNNLAGLRDDISYN